MAKRLRECGGGGGPRSTKCNEWLQKQHYSTQFSLNELQVVTMKRSE